MACVICGEKPNSKVLLFPRLGGPFPISLCYTHEREIFLRGQDKFILRHVSALKGSSSGEAREILNSFKNRVQKSAA